MPSLLELIGTFSTEELVFTIIELAYEPANSQDIMRSLAHHPV